MSCMQNHVAYTPAHKQRLSKFTDLFSPSTALANNYHVHDINPGLGHGSNDLYDFGRICLGRGHFCFKQATQLQCEMPFRSFGITVFLTGTCKFTRLENGEEYEVKAPQIFLRKGQFGPVVFSMPARTPVTTLSMEFNIELLEKISSSIRQNKVTRFFQDLDRSEVMMLDTLDPKLVCAMHYLVGLPKASSELDLINIEGVALSLLGSLFTLPLQQDDKYRKEVEQAIAILESRCSEKITIPKLARQVGMNECYLKRYFKQYTGLTISAFLEKHRMDIALLLFSQGKAAQDVAYDIGYDNFYYFKNVFKKRFGYFPGSERSASVASNHPVSPPGTGIVCSGPT